MLAIENYRPGTPPVTAARLWLFDRRTWDTSLSAVCHWCGNRFIAKDVWLGREIACPSAACGKPLKLNPFVCDNRDRMI